MYVDINCDMGESFGIYKLGMDEEIMDYISSANIACGFHGGDPLVMENTVRKALEKGVAIGAHPGFPDLLGFGRRRLETFKGEIRAYILYQIGALDAFCKAFGASLQHVKPHGALYNMASVDEEVAREIVEAIKSFDSSLIVVTQAGSKLHKIAEAEGLAVAREFFPDRAYCEDGRLAPRSMKGSVIQDVKEVRERVRRFVEKGLVRSIEGKDISLEADTFCIHGDGPHALEFAMNIKEELYKTGVKISSMGTFLKRV